MSIQALGVISTEPSARKNVKNVEPVGVEPVLNEFSSYTSTARSSRDNEIVRCSEFKASEIFESESVIT